MDGTLSTRNIERKDGWTPELDQILLDIVTKGLSEGLTQVACFARASEKIGKSNSACAFRFNTTIRKQASDAIERAKLAGKGKKPVEQEENIASDIPTQSEKEDKVFQQEEKQQVLQSDITGFEVIETFQKLQKFSDVNHSDVNQLYSDLGQPSLETVIQMLQMIQQHNGLAEENTYRRKMNQLENLVSDALNQVEQLKLLLQITLDELQIIKQ